VADVAETFWERAANAFKRVRPIRSAHHGQDHANRNKAGNVESYGISFDQRGMFGFRTKSKSKLTKGVLGFDVGNIIGNDPLMIVRPGASKSVSAIKTMSNIRGWSYAAIKAISDEIACIEFKVYQIQKNNNHVELTEHELLDVLEAGNPEQTGPELRWTLAGHLEATGNAFGLMTGVKSYNDKPDAIYLLNPAFVTVDLDQTIYPYVLKGYQYEIDNRKYYYQPYEIIHFKTPDLNNPHEGIGTMQAIAEWIDNDNFAMEFNRQFFINGANMDGVFETEYTTEEQILALKTGWESNHQGVENAHKTGILPKGVSWKQTQSTMKDMGFKELLEMTRDRILAGFRVSKTILGTAESDTNRATAETADYVFAKRTIKPKMQMICSTLNEFLAPRYGDNIYISFKDPTPEDRAAVNTEMQAVMGSQPVMSVNEAREKYQGLGPIDGGDDVMVGNNLVPVGTPPPEYAPAPASKSAESIQKTVKPMQKAGKAIHTRAAQNFKARQTMQKKAADLLVAKLKEIKSIKKKAWGEMTKEEYYYIWKDLDSRIAKKEPEVKKILKELNAKQKKEVLDNIDGKFSKTFRKAGMPDPFNLKSWIKISIDALTPVLSEVYKNEGEIAGAGVGKPGINLLEDVNSRNALDEAISLMSESYNQTTLDQLKAKLGEAMQSGASVQQATDLVSGIYDLADTTRAATVAQTELFRVANMASKESWKQAGVLEMKWQAFDDDLTCEFCKEMDGKVESVDNNYLDNGDDFTGADGGKLNIDYADVGSPPLHPNCRCGLQPQEVPQPD